MLALILGAIALACLCLAYVFYIKPKSQSLRYAKLLTALGYKVHVHPFSLFTSSFIQQEKEQLLKYGDVRYINKNGLIGTDFIISNLFNKIVIISNSPEVMKEMFTPDKVDLHHKLSFTFHGITSLIGQGLIFSEGDTWRAKRKIISKLFTFEMLLENIPKICEICDKVLDEADIQCQSGDTTVSFDVKDMASKMFSSVILKCFLGIENVNQKIKDQKLPVFLVNLLENISSTAGTLPALVFGKYAYSLGLSKRTRDVREKCHLYRKVCFSMIQERKKIIYDKFSKKKPEKYSDILEALVGNHEEMKQKGKNDEAMTNEELFEQLSNFLMAGTDTTSALLQIMVYYIAQYPQVGEKLRLMVDEVIKSDKDFNYSNLKKLQYIDWIQQETLRMDTPVPGILLRIAKSDHLLADIPIAKGTLLGNTVLSSQYNPVYFKDPKVFRPQRWQSECENLPPFVLFGFSAGPRNCIGKQLALLESKIALIKLLKRYPIISLPVEKRTMVRRFLYEPKPASFTFTKRSS